jgi:hypothetical protein
LIPSLHDTILLGAIWRRELLPHTVFPIIFGEIF